MALGELASKVVVTYRADTTDIKAKIRELTGEERKLAQAQLDSAEKHNAGLEKQVKGLAKMTAGFEVMKMAGIDLGAQFRELTGTTGQLTAAGFALGGAWGAAAGFVLDLANEHTTLFDSMDVMTMAMPGMREELQRQELAFRAFQSSIADAADELQRITGRVVKKGDFIDVGKLLLRGGADGGAEGRERAKPVKAGPARRTNFGDNARIGGSDFDFEFGATVPGGALADSLPRDEFGREVVFDTEALLKNRIKGNAAADKAASDKRESKLAGMFGPLSEFSGYTMAFQTLSGAVGSAMSAWIDGSMSAGKAFKAFVGEAVKGIAIQMAMEALKHGAYAIGALAMGDAKSAALHGTSAAKFAAGAIVAAGAAKALGSSGSAPGVGGGASGGGASAGTSAPAQSGTQTIIAYGDSFADDSPRQRILRAGRILSRVSGTSGIEYA